MIDARQLARLCKVLSLETRVRLLLHLKEKALCVNALAGRLGISPSAVSQHLRLLRDADLVVPDKRGYYVHYELKRETLNRWRELLDGLLAEDVT